MPKKEWTDAERKAFGDKMRALKAEKLARKESDAVVSGLPALPEPEEAGQAPTTEIPNALNSADLNELLRRMQELEAMNWRLMAQAQPQAPVGPQVGQQGLVGTHERYKIEKGYYPDPRARLADEPRLQRFAFKDNYELGWEVGVSAYKTMDGVNTKEPKFTIELNRVIYDEDSGEKTPGRYTICRGIFHEDPEAALVVARDNGIEVDETEERTFLNEMRYLRMRDWLIDAFYPPKPAQAKQNKKDMVIGGKMVEYFEINSETAETVPFGQLKNKL